MECLIPIIVQIKESTSEGKKGPTQALKGVPNNGCISLRVWRLGIYGNTAKMEIKGNVRKQDLVYLKKKK